MNRWSTGRHSWSCRLRGRLSNGWLLIHHITLVTGIRTDSVLYSIIPGVNTLIYSTLCTNGWPEGGSQRQRGGKRLLRKRWEDAISSRLSLHKATAKTGNGNKKQSEDDERKCSGAYLIHLMCTQRTREEFIDSLQWTLRESIKFNYLYIINAILALSLSTYPLSLSCPRPPSYFIVSIFRSCTGKEFIVIIKIITLRFSTEILVLMSPECEITTTTVLPAYRCVLYVRLVLCLFNTAIVNVLMHRL